MPDNSTPLQQASEATEISREAFACGDVAAGVAALSLHGPCDPAAIVHDPANEAMVKVVIVGVLNEIAENERLKADIATYVEMATKHVTEIDRLREVVKHARQLVAEGHYCTVAQAGSGAGPGNRLRDALDALDAAEGGR